MKLKIIIATLILISSTLFSEVVELGIHGHMYDIQEEHFMEEVKRKINDKAKQMNFKKLAKESVMKGSIGKTDLPFGQELTSYEMDNYQILQHDVLNPAGRVFKKKGEKLIINTQRPISICFIDGSNKIMFQNQIDYFDKVTKKKYGEFAECTYMVSNKSVIELREEYFGRKFYPSQKIYEDRFMVKSIPTYIHMEKTKRQVYTFPIDMFKHEVKIK